MVAEHRGRPIQLANGNGVEHRIAIAVPRPKHSLALGLQQHQRERGQLGVLHVRRPQPTWRGLDQHHLATCAMTGPSFDPKSGEPNYGFSMSDLAEGSLGPFTVLGHSVVANYDGTQGSDTSFDNDRNEEVTNRRLSRVVVVFPLPEPVENGPQVLTGLSYTRDSWRHVLDTNPDEPPLFEDAALHRESGYLLWIPKRSRATGSSRCREV